jgi:hypothetical protein
MNMPPAQFTENRRAHQVITDPASADIDMLGKAKAGSVEESESLPQERLRALSHSSNN